MILSILDQTGGGGNERRRYLQIGLLALAVLLVAVLGFRLVQRWVSPQQEVWVSAADMPAGTTIGPSSLKRVKLAESALPKGTLLDARAIAGRSLARAKQAGEPFVGTDFASTGEQIAAVAEMVPEGRVLTTIRVPKGLVPYKNLKNGDRVDLIAVGPARAGSPVRIVARDAYLVGTIFTQEQAPGGRNSLADVVASSAARPKTDPTLGLVLALHPEDALPLAQAYGSGGSIQVVLHGSSEVASGQLLELPERAATGVEFIAGDKTERLMVNQ